MEIIKTEEEFDEFLNKEFDDVQLLDMYASQYEYLVDYTSCPADKLHEQALFEVWDGNIFGNFVGEVDFQITNEVALEVLERRIA